MTIRNPSTGQEMTLNYSDIAEGTGGSSLQ